MVVLYITDSFMEREDYVFVLTVLKKIAEHPNEKKFRNLKADSAIVKRVKPLLESIGFRESDDKQWVLIHGPVEDLIPVYQEKVDAMLDPETITFAQVAEIMKRDGTLPGIKTDIDDSVIESRNLLEECVAPRKPWETDLEPSFQYDS